MTRGTGDRIGNGTVTGVRTFQRDPAPRDSAVPVTFAEIFAEAQNEAGRYAIHARDLETRAAETADPAQKAELILAAQSRARLAQVFDAMMRLVDRVRGDAAIMARLKVVAAEQKARDAIDAPKSEQRDSKDKSDDTATGAADSGADQSPGGEGAADDD